MASQNPTAMFGICKFVSLKNQTSSKFTLKLLAIGLVVSLAITIPLQLILVKNLLLRLPPDFLSRRQRRAICLG